MGPEQVPELGVLAHAPHDAAGVVPGRGHDAPEGVLLVPGEVVVGVVPGDDHEREHGDVLAVAALHEAEGAVVVGEALNSRDVDVPAAGGDEPELELAVRRVREVGGAVAHEDHGVAVRLGAVRGSDRIDEGVEVLGGGEQGPSDGDGVEPAPALLHLLHDMFGLIKCTSRRRGHGNKDSSGIFVGNKVCLGGFHQYNKQYGCCNKRCSNNPFTAEKECQRLLVFCKHASERRIERDMETR